MKDYQIKTGLYYGNVQHCFFTPDWKLSNHILIMDMRSYISNFAQIYTFSMIG